MLRLTAWVALALTIGLAFRGPARQPVRAVEGVPSVDVLVGWAMAPPADTLAVALDGLPSDTARARLVALRGAGMAVTWRDGGVSPLAAEVEFDEVTGRGVIRTAGDAAEATDGAGPIGAVTGALTVPGLVLPVTVGVRPSIERIAMRRTVVVGTPTWESRWVVRALEEAGWTVDAALEIAPGLTTPTPPFDTATVGVVVVLGRVTAPVARALARYVRSGGGLVLTPDALASPELAAMTPGVVGPAERPPASLALPDSRADLSFRPVVRLSPSALSLEPGRVAARVEGNGRVVLVGDIETWRLALASDAGRTAHRAFWVQVVEAARYRPLGARIAGDPAPRAALAAAFGPPSGARLPWVPGLPWEAMAFGLTMALLVAEWGLRRLRGAA